MPPPLEGGHKGRPYDRWPSRPEPKGDCHEIEFLEPRSLAAARPGDPRHRRPAGPGGRSPAVTRRPASAPPAAASRLTAVAAEGRVVAYPGAEVVVGTDLAGTIVVLKVQEKEKVRRGQLLAELRSDDHRAALAEAKARVVEADADIRLAEAEVERARALWQKDVGSRQAVDKAERDVDAARARRQTAAATADRLEAVLAKTRILSPIDGVDRRPARPGGRDARGRQADRDRRRPVEDPDRGRARRVRFGPRPPPGARCA